MREFFQQNLMQLKIRIKMISMKNFKCLFQIVKCFEFDKQLHKNVVRLIHQKHLPPLLEKKKAKDIKEAKGDDDSPAKIERIQRGIFGATILPQNLSFENSKKLTENKISLKDIPVIDENDAAEELVTEKLKGKKVNISKETTTEKTKEVEETKVGETDLVKNLRILKKPAAELFWSADPYDDIPGPKIFRKLLNALKQCIRQLTIVYLFRFIKLNDLESFQTYGQIIKLPAIFGGKIVLISRPELISAIFDQDYRYPVNSIWDSIQRSWLHRRRQTSQTAYYLNEEWEGIKKGMKNSRLKEPENYYNSMDELASKFVKRIKTIRNRQNEVPDDFLFEINKWSLEGLCSVVFDKSFGFLDYDSISWPDKTSQLLFSLTVATKYLCHLETGFHFWRFMNTSSLSSFGSSCSILENLISEYLGQVQLDLIKKRDHSSGQFKGDFGNVSLIQNLLLQDNLSPDEIVSYILDTLLIGMNTMSAALGFLLYHITQNPRVQSELYKEVKKNLPEKYSRLEYEQLSSLKYVRASLKESLRLKMPIPILTRVLSKNIILNNYQIPKGTLILMTAQVEGIKKENFEDPSEFFPERWFDQEKCHPFTSLPLRNYFENSFEKQIAEESICICIAHIIRQFHIEYQYGEINITSTAISFPNKPLKFTFIDRKE